MQEIVTKKITKEDEETQIAVDELWYKDFQKPKVDDLIEKAKEEKCYDECEVAARYLTSVCQALGWEMKRIDGRFYLCMPDSLPIGCHDERDTEDRAWYRFYIRLYLSALTRDVLKEIE